MQPLPWSTASVTALTNSASRTIPPTRWWARAVAKSTPPRAAGRKPPHHCIELPPQVRNRTCGTQRRVRVDQGSFLVGTVSTRDGDGLPGSRHNRGREPQQTGPSAQVRRSAWPGGLDAAPVPATQMSWPSFTTAPVRRHSGPSNSDVPAKLHDRPDSAPLRSRQLRCLGRASRPPSIWHYSGPGGSGLPGRASRPSQCGAAPVLAARRGRPAGADGACGGLLGRISA